MANKQGRPTIFSGSVLDDANAYINFFLMTEEQRQKVGDKRKNLFEVLPSVAGLAIYLNIARSTLQAWEKSNNEFSGTLERLKAVQEVLLVNGGLRGDLNPTIAKLMLANHGYTDKQDIKLSVNPLSDLIDEIGNEARGDSVHQKEDRG